MKRRGEIWRGERWRGEERDEEERREMERREERGGEDTATLATVNNTKVKCTSFLEELVDALGAAILECPVGLEVLAHQLHLLVRLVRHVGVDPMRGPQ